MESMETTLTIIAVLAIPAYLFIRGFVRGYRGEKGLVLPPVEPPKNMYWDLNMGGIIRGTADSED